MFLSFCDNFINKWNIICFDIIDEEEEDSFRLNLLVISVLLKDTDENKKTR